MNCCKLKEIRDTPQPNARTCTDVCGLILFILLIIFMTCTAIFAYVLGDPTRLVHGYDSFGNICGTDNPSQIGKLGLSGRDMTSKRYVFYMDTQRTRSSLQICVQACPSRDIRNLEELRKYSVETESSLCLYTFDVTDNDTEISDHGLSEVDVKSSWSGPCPKFPIRRSTSYLNRCIPTEEPVPLSSFLKTWDFAEQVMADIYSAWYIFTFLCLLALITSLAIVLLFTFCPNCVIYIILSLTTVMTIGFVSVLWWNYCFPLTTDTMAIIFMEQAISNNTVLLASAIIATIIGIIILFLILYASRKVNGFEKLLKECDTYLKQLPALYLQPVFSFIQLMIFYAFWIVIIVYLASARAPGTEEVRPFADESLNSSLLEAINANDSKIFMKKSVYDFKSFTRVEFLDVPWIHYMWWLYIVGLIWISEFILGCQQMITTGAIGWNYFEGQSCEDRHNAPRKEIQKSVRLMLSHHLGSVAVGSVVLTLFKVPRLIINQIYKRCRHRDAYASKCTCEKYVRYVNPSAYTVVLVRGIGFYPACDRVWAILTSPMDSLNWKTAKELVEGGDLIFFLSKTLVTFITGLAAFFAFSRSLSDGFVAVPTILVCFFAFFIAHCVICTYEVVGNTLFLCMREDQDLKGDLGRWKQSLLLKSDEESIFQADSP